MAETRKRLQHWRLHYTHPCYWSAGGYGCCGVWYYRTPWGALWGARKRHKVRVRPVEPAPQWVKDASEAIARARAEGFKPGQVAEQWGKTPTGPIILKMDPEIR